MTRDATARQVNTGTEAESKQVKCSYGWPCAPTVGAINMPSTHLGEGHCVTNRPIYSQEEAGYTRCTNNSFPETSKENICSGELNTCIQKADQRQISCKISICILTSGDRINWCRQCFLNHRTSLPRGDKSGTCAI